MGVHNLWALLEPVGRRVAIETISNKRLAVDASIWIFQFMKAMRDEKGEMMRNAHLLGFFRRICRLLFHRVRPVFVFDGATPALKRLTNAARRRRREAQEVMLRKTAEKLLMNKLKAGLISRAKSEAQQRKERKNNSADKAPADTTTVKTAMAAPGGRPQSAEEWAMQVAARAATRAAVAAQAAATATGMDSVIPEQTCAHSGCKAAGPSAAAASAGTSTAALPALAHAVAAEEQEAVRQSARDKGKASMTVSSKGMLPPACRSPQGQLVWEEQDAELARRLDERLNGPRQGTLNIADASTSQPPPAPPMPARAASHSNAAVDAATAAAVAAHDLEADAGKTDNSDGSTNGFGDGSAEDEDLLKEEAYVNALRAGNQALADRILHAVDWHALLPGSAGAGGSRHASRAGRSGGSKHGQLRGTISTQGALGGTSGSNAVLAMELSEAVAVKAEDADDLGTEMLLLPEDGEEMDPEVLATLPMSVQLTVLASMRERLNMVNREKFQAAAAVKPEHFSMVQIGEYLKMSTFKQKINSYKMAIGNVTGEDGVQVRKIASEENREFIFQTDVPHTGHLVKREGCGGRAVGLGRHGSQASTHNAAAISGALTRLTGGRAARGGLPALSVSLGGLAAFKGTFAAPAVVEDVEGPMKGEDKAMAAVEAVTGPVPLANRPDSFKVDVRLSGLEDEADDDLFGSGSGSSDGAISDANERVRLSNSERRQAAVAAAAASAAAAAAEAAAQQRDQADAAEGDGMEWEDVEEQDMPGGSGNGASVQGPQHWRDRMAARQKYWSTAYGFKMGRKLASWGEEDDGPALVVATRSKPLPGALRLGLLSKTADAGDASGATSADDDAELQRAIQASLQEAAVPSPDEQQDTGSDADLVWEGLTEETQQPKVQMMDPLPDDGMLGGRNATAAGVAPDAGQRPAISPSNLAAAAALPKVSLRGASGRPNKASTAALISGINKLSQQILDDEPPPDALLPEGAGPAHPTAPTAAGTGTATLGPGPCPTASMFSFVAVASTAPSANAVPVAGVAFVMPEGARGGPAATAPATAPVGPAALPFAAVSKAEGPAAAATAAAPLEDAAGSVHLYGEAAEGLPHSAGFSTGPSATSTAVTAAAAQQQLPAPAGAQPATGATSVADSAGGTVAGAMGNDIDWADESVMAALDEAEARALRAASTFSAAAQPSVLVAAAGGAAAAAAASLLATTSAAGVPPAVACPAAPCSNERDRQAQLPRDGQGPPRGMTAPASGTTPAHARHGTGLGFSGPWGEGSQQEPPAVAATVLAAGSGSTRGQAPGDSLVQPPASTAGSSEQCAVDDARGKVDSLAAAPAPIFPAAGSREAAGQGNSATSTAAPTGAVVSAPGAVTAAAQASSGVYVDPAPVRLAAVEMSEWDQEMDDADYFDEDPSYIPLPPPTAATALAVPIQPPDQSSQQQQRSVPVAHDSDHWPAGVYGGHPLTSGAHAGTAHPADTHGPGSRTKVDQSQDLDDQLAALESESVSLRQMQTRAQRNAEAPTAEMYAECQELLQMFGIPFITAPTEAEAQCAWLDARGLVDGVVTDDNDVFLFGGQHVYRNIFDGKKYVEEYHMRDVESELGLVRERLVELALLLGSDYTEGVAGIGIVNAIEVVNAFPGHQGLRKLRAWLEKPSEALLDLVHGTGAGEEAEGVGEPEDGETQLMRAFKRSHKGARKTWDLPASFPNMAVIQGYLSPLVDPDKSKFQWGRPDVEMLRVFCRDKFGWPAERTDELLEPVLRVHDERTAQRRIDEYLTLSQRFAKFRSKRLQNAVERITGNVNPDLVLGGGVIDGGSGLVDERDQSDHDDGATKISQNDAKKKRLQQGVGGQVARGRGRGRKAGALRQGDGTADGGEDVARRQQDGGILDAETPPAKRQRSLKKAPQASALREAEAMVAGTAEGKAPSTSTGVTPAEAKNGAPTGMAATAATPPTAAAPQPQATPRKASQATRKPARLKAKEVVAALDEALQEDHVDGAVKDVAVQPAETVQVPSRAKRPRKPRKEAMPA